MTVNEPTAGEPEPSGRRHEAVRPSMSPAPARRVPHVAGLERLAASEPPDVVAEIRILRGRDAAELARQQARVLWEVTEWAARTASASGRERAA